MRTRPEIDALRRRRAPLEMGAGEFREIGHRLVDDIAERLARMPDGPVTPDDSPAELRRLLGAEQALPSAGADAGANPERGHANSCSTTRCSTGIRDFSATSRRVPRRSECSATCSPPP